MQIKDKKQLPHHRRMKYKQQFTQEIKSYEIRIRVKIFLNEETFTTWTCKK